MLWLIINSSPMELYLRIRLLSSADPEKALELYRDSSQALPDSLRLLLSAYLGMDYKKVLKEMVEGGSADGNVLKIFFLLKYKEYKKDERSFDRIVKRYEKKIDTLADVLGFVGKIYENYGNLEKALKFYRLSLSRERTQDIMRSAVVLFARLDMCDSALSYFQGVEADTKDTFETWRLFTAVGTCYERTGDVDKALKYYKKAYSLRKDTAVGFRIADILAKRGEAIPFLEKMQEDLGIQRPNLHWGYALIMKDDTESIKRGIQELAYYIALRGDDPKARNLLMHAFLRLGDTSTAVKHARRAYEIDPKDDDYRLTYAYLLSYTTSNPRKFGHLLRNRDKRDPLGMWAFARFYRLQGDSKRALKYYEEIVKIDPANLSLGLEAYWYAKSTGRLELALRIIKNLKDHYPENLEFWYELGDMYTLMNMPDSVHSMYSDLIKRYSFKLKECELATVLNNWAYSLALTSSRLDTARVLADRAYNLCSLDYILDTRAWIYFLLGKREKAKEMIREVVKDLPEDDVNLPEIYLHFLLIRCHSDGDVEKSLLDGVSGLIDPKRLRFYGKFLRSCRPSRR